MALCRSQEIGEGFYVEGRGHRIVILVDDYSGTRRKRTVRFRVYGVKDLEEVTASYHQDKVPVIDDIIVGVSKNKGSHADETSVYCGAPDDHFLDRLEYLPGTSVWGSEIKPYKLLFVDTGRADRSPTAVEVADELAREKDIKVEAKCAGLVVDAIGKLEQKHVDWAHTIFVMEPDMKDSIIEYGKPADKVKVLNIPDIYNFRDTELVSTLQERLRPYFGL